MLKILKNGVIQKQQYYLKRFKMTKDKKLEKLKDAELKVNWEIEDLAQDIKDTTVSLCRMIEELYDKSGIDEYDDTIDYILEKQKYFNK